jgi:ribosomal protein L37AE/L43A
MASKKKKIKSFGKFSTGHGVRVRHNYNEIESLQRKRQNSPFHPKGRTKRLAAGIWKCLKTGKIFAGPAYTLEKKK